MQFHIPSVVQALPATSADPEPVVPVDVPELGAGEAEEATGLATGAALGIDDATGAADTAGAEDTAAAEEATGTSVVGLATGATVAKTPPGIPAADVDFWVALGEEAAAEVAVEPVPDPEPDPEPPEAAVAHDPDGATGVAVAVPRRSRESPGEGNFRSVESTVVQPLPMFAVNMSGKASKAAVSRSMSCVTLPSSLRLEEDPDRVTGAQFMYISRLPILLNQVQARVASPVGRVVGTVNEYVSGFTAAALSPLFPATP